MNFSALLFILLFSWIFILHNKVNALKKSVDALKDKKHFEPVNDESRVSRAKEESVPKAIEEYTVDEKDEVASSLEVATDSSTQIYPKENSKIIGFFTNYFTQGNLLVRVGGVILFFGLAFLVKYAAEHSAISMQMRLWALSAVAVTLVAVGWKLRKREGAYGQILQGLGVAILYLVIYAASKFYALLSLDMAFGFMLLVVILGSALAVIENALPLALFAAAGGFLVPLLTSSGEGSPILLFGYYALLDLGLFFVAWYRSWRILNIVGFLFTFVIATYWGVLRYDANLFAITEPFLILYFLMYLGISILFTVKHPYEPKNLVDATLVFGLPLVAFPLQVSLVEPMEYGAAYSAIAMGTLYLLLAKILANKERTGLLAQSFLALGIVFYTIAVPYLFDADVSAALWSLESSAIIWIALKQSRKYARYFGELLLFVSIIIYPDAVSAYGINMAEYIGYIIIIAATLIASYLLDTHQSQLSNIDRHLPKILLFLSIVLWFTSAPWVFDHFDVSSHNAMILYLSLGVFLLYVVSRFVYWKLLVDSLQGYMVLGIVFFFIETMSTTEAIHPFSGIGYLALVSLMALNYFLLYTFEKVWHYARAIHIVSLWFAALVLVLELRFHAANSQIGNSFIQLATAIAPLLLSLLVLIPKKYKTWLEPYRDSYQLIGAGGLAAVLLLWEIQAFSVAPDFTIIRYMPLFNPLDTIQVIGLAVIFYWVFCNSQQFVQTTRISLYALLVFISTLLVSVIFARAVHMFRSIDYTLVALWQSVYFQAGLSILWSSIAIMLMLLSKRYHNRQLWLAAFGLLVIVVLKLFFVELANSGTIERIISFIVVGSLLLLVGYFVPLPPNKQNEGLEGEDE